MPEDYREITAITADPLLNIIRCYKEDGTVIWFRKYATYSEMWDELKRINSAWKESLNIKTIDKRK